MFDLHYLLTPFIAWLVTGCVKFAVNCVKEKRLAFDLVGYGGMPSNHSAIVCSMAALIGFNHGLDSAAFGVAVTLAYIVMMDANGLRQKIAKHAVAINQIEPSAQLRERMGHTKAEIVAGALLGIVIGYLIHLIQ